MDRDCKYSKSCGHEYCTGQECESYEESEPKANPMSTRPDVKRYNLQGYYEDPLMGDTDAELDITKSDSGEWVKYSDLELFTDQLQQERDLTIKELGLTANREGHLMFAISALKVENEQLRRDGHALALENHELEQERDELEEANSILYDSMMRTAEQRNRAKEDLTALKAENEKARDNLNDLAETIDQFIKCPESKAARRVLINAQSFLKGAQDE